MSESPLSNRANMSNSIVKFVLENPGHKNSIEAYNAWVIQNQWRDFPWTNPDTVPFCLHMFHFCMNQIPREMLDEIWYREQLMLQGSYDVPG